MSCVAAYTSGTHHVDLDIGGLSNSFAVTSALGNVSATALTLANAANAVNLLPGQGACARFVRYGNAEASEEGGVGPHMARLKLTNRHDFIAISAETFRCVRPLPSRAMPIQV